MVNYNLYERRVLENLPKNDRNGLISLLEVDLSKRLTTFRDWDGYWREVNKVINDLRSVNHDLWSHDYDGEGKHLWGWDYMRMETAGFLQIQFDFHGKVRIFWREDDPRLGVVNEDE